MRPARVPAKKNSKIDMPRGVEGNPPLFWYRGHFHIRRLCDSSQTSDVGKMQTPTDNVRPTPLFNQSLYRIKVMYTFSNGTTDICTFL